MATSTYMTFLMHKKETAWEKILGIVLIISAAPVAALILGWF